MKPRIIFHVIAVLVLVGAVAAAQSSPQKTKPAPNGTHDRESSAPSVSEVALSNNKSSDRKSGSVIVADRDSASGQVSGKRQHADAKADDSASADQQGSLNSRNSAHATESLNDQQKSRAQSNPMYKDNQTQGNNPLFESKDKAAAKPSGNGSTTKPVEYKDGEDQTTHARPASNKPSK